MKIVKNKRISLALILLISLSFLVFFVAQNNKPAFQSIQNDRKIISNASSDENRIVKKGYTSHAPINITSDADLIVFPGSGTKDDPYVIENYNITNSGADGIHISGTTKYILIRNCYLDGENSNYSGISISSVAEGTVNVTNNSVNYYWNGISLYYSSNNSFTSNTITNSSFFAIDLRDSSNNNAFTSNTITNSSIVGIDLRDSSNNNAFTSNTITNSGYVGIFLYCYSNNNAFTSNTITNSGYEGIFLYCYSNNNSFTSNTITNSNFAGVYLEGDSNNNSFTSNTITNSGYDGIHLRSGSNNNAFTSNTITNSGNDGIYLVDSSTNSFASNTIINSSSYGIYLMDYSNTNTFVKNILIKNNPSGSSQGYDDGDGTGNKFYSGTTGNYWYDWSGTGVYAIDGSANNFDPYPMHIDLDQDNMPDRWEEDNGLNTNIDDSAEDPDTDELTNLDEYQTGTDPNDPDTDNLQYRS